MAWAANFDDFLNMAMTYNPTGNWTSGMHSAFGDVTAETMSIADLYSGMPVVVCLFNSSHLFLFCD